MASPLLDVPAFLGINVAVGILSHTALIRPILNFNKFGALRENLKWLRNLTHRPVRFASTPP